MPPVARGTRGCAPIDMSAPEVPERELGLPSSRSNGVIPQAEARPRHAGRSANLSCSHECPVFRPCAPTLAHAQLREGTACCTCARAPFWGRFADALYRGVAICGGGCLHERAHDAWPLHAHAPLGPWTPRPTSLSSMLPWPAPNLLPRPTQARAARMGQRGVATMASVLPAASTSAPDLKDDFASDSRPVIL